MCTNDHDVYSALSKQSKYIMSCDEMALCVMRMKATQARASWAKLSMRLHALWLTYIRMQYLIRCDKNITYQGMKDDLYAAFTGYMKQIHY